MGIWQTAEWSSGRVRVALSPSLPPSPLYQSNLPI